MITIRNLTPHTVNVVDENGITVMELPSEGNARATQSAITVGIIEGVEIVRMAFGEPAGLPDPEKGVFLVVSRITAEAAKAFGRTTNDLLLTADPVRDGEGRIIGCRRFSIL